MFDYKYRCMECGSENVEYLNPDTIVGAEPLPEGVENFQCLDCGHVTTYATPILKTMLIPKVGFGRKMIGGGDA